MKAIIEKNYYHPDFNGSYSIKAVLPALVKNMSYDDFEIKNGDMAVAAFVKMAIEQLLPDEILKLRQQLLDYCKQDTLAMVELHKALAQISGYI